MNTNDLERHINSYIQAHRLLPAWQGETTSLLEGAWISVFASKVDIDSYEGRIQRAK